MGLVLSAIALTALACGQPRTTLQQTQTAESATVAPATADTPAPGAPAAYTVTPPMSPIPPLPAVRTPIPGAAEDGLFADGVSHLEHVDTAGWKTYSNSKYGFEFQYPADWELRELDNSGHVGLHGEPSYPLYRVEVRNPPAEQGQKVPGQNCTAAVNDCPGPPPGFTGFIIAIWGWGECNISGDLIVSDTVALSGRQGARCVVEYPNDKSRTVAIYVSLPGGTYLGAELDKGNSVTPAQQAALETILSTFTFMVGVAPTPR